MSPGIAITILLVTFFLLIILSFPVAYAIGIASVVGMIYMKLDLNK